MGLFNEKIRLAFDTIDGLKRDLVTVDRWLSSIRDSLSQEDFETVIERSSEARMLIGKCARELDKISVVASNQFRDNVIAGFQPRETMLGNGSRDIAKSDSENLIGDILKGRVRNAKQIMDRVS